jgi:hypothetical protein
VLLTHSFSHGLIHPATALVHVSPRQYAGYLLHGVKGLAVQCSLWTLLGALVWRRSESERSLLIVAASFCILHILAFPISEPRYFVTVFLLVVALLVETFVSGDPALMLTRSERHAELSGANL